MPFDTQPVVRVAARLDVVDGEAEVGKLAPVCALVRLLHRHLLGLPFLPVQDEVRAAAVEDAGGTPGGELARPPLLRFTRMVDQRIGRAGLLRCLHE